MEQMILLLVFAFAAAICMQAFVLSDKISAQCDARDNAVIAAQSAAEAIKYASGDTEKAAEILGAESKDGILTAMYDENWNITDNSGAYILTVRPEPAEISGLYKAEVCVNDVNDSGDILFSLEVMWQGAK